MIESEKRNEVDNASLNSPEYEQYMKSQGTALQEYDLESKSGSMPPLYESDITKTETQIGINTSSLLSESKLIEAKNSRVRRHGF